MFIKITSKVNSVREINSMVSSYLMKSSHVTRVETSKLFDNFLNCSGLEKQFYENLRYGIETIMKY